jgi:Cu/Ag efflux pump CusA
MTASVMICGMVPLAIGFGEGGAQAAPLGRAVVGGLIFSTMTMLSALPGIFFSTGPRSGSCTKIQNVFSEFSVAVESGMGASAAGS